MYGPYSGPSTDAQTFVQRLKQVMVTHGQRTADLQLGLVTTSCNGGTQINPLSGHDCTGPLAGQLWLVNNRNGVLTKVAPVRTSTLPGTAAPIVPSVQPFTPAPPLPAIAPILSIVLDGDDITLNWTAAEPPSSLATSTAPVRYLLHVSPVTMAGNPSGVLVYYDGNAVTYTFTPARWPVTSPATDGPTGHWFMIEAIAAWGTYAHMYSNEVNSPIIETDDATDVT